MKVQVADFATTSRVARALSSPNRLGLLALVSESPKTVAELHSAFRNEIKNRDSIWRHLETLREAGLVIRSYDDDRRKWYYRLKEEQVVFVLAARQLRK
jgi:DNA-binding transcriptional ArsR family regulator